jgi:hypothetical protein
LAREWIEIRDWNSWWMNRGILQSKEKLEGRITEGEVEVEK